MWRSEEKSGGLYIPHNFAVVSVYKAGCNLNVLPGVVIGKKAVPGIPYENAVIGDDCTLCANCTIIGPVTIADGAVVGAGSVVTKDVAAGSIVVGNPVHEVK